MKKKTLLIPALSTVLVSTAVLTNTVYADEPVENAVLESSVALPPQVENNLVEPQAENSEVVATEAPAETLEVLPDTTEISEPTSEESQPQAIAEDNDTNKSAQENPVVSETDGTVTIINTNDIHGRIEEGRDVIGMAKLATIVKETRSQGETLVLDAGDAFQGMPISNSSKGEDMAKLMNQIGFDAMAVGNHEFDFSLEQAIKLEKMLEFPLLSVNTYVDGVRLFKPSVIIDKDKTIEGDEFVVIGVTTPETATKTHPKNVEKVVFRDPISEVENAIAEIEARAKAEGVSYKNYIVLGHLGIDASTKKEWQGSTMAEALSKNPLLKDKRVLMIDGHSHTLAEATYGDNTIYSQTGSYLNNVGKIVLTKDDMKVSFINAEQGKAYEADPEVAATVAEIKKRYEEVNAVVVVDASPVELQGERANVRVRETNLGNLISDSLLEYSKTGFSRPSNLAVMNGGGIRATIQKGQPITKGDIIAILPFGNFISQIKVTGKQVVDMFAHSLGSMVQKDSETGEVIRDENGQPLLGASGGFLHVSGANVYYDTNLEGEARILYVELLNPETGLIEPLDFAKDYYLTTNDFLAAGGDGYDMLGGAREEGPSMDVVFAEYLETVDLNDYEVINPNSRLISIDSTLDTDNDGFPDFIELILMTDPSNAENYPGMKMKDEKHDKQMMMSMDKKKSDSSKQVPVSYAKKYDTLPNTGSSNDTMLILLGLSMTTLGLYGIKKRSYGR
ncbi:cell surface ecto-5'-nucleotidase Nt5e [Streptococcus zalophi]|uniref:5'-nucleotidase C-terminal domain-containing protein n=1 Tax=Streptococcus zalophi TaxID=640031 RepID=A0A934UE27_9STRE|nr:cell surface ecto-5'-nucleotidase Nt5e [Streptococcus zalophi]MBJ8350416.1 5'-nucleotidase C-terminal domain-containing protein [Streptococcus zalophi]